MTTHLEGPTTFDKFGDWTTQLLGDKGVVDVLGHGVPTKGGGTPSVEMAKMGVDGPSLDLSISLLTGTPIISESKR